MYSLNSVNYCLDSGGHFTEPTCYDIFLGNLHKTKHLGVVQNSIAGGRNCILIGAAVTGKTTLLKQLANITTDQVQSLYIDDITPEKARLLVKDIDAEGVNFATFIDNAADAWEAIRILYTSANI